MSETMTRVKAIKTYFERVDSISSGGGRKVTLEEQKDLGAENRQELAALAAVELGVELDVPAS